MTSAITAASSEQSRIQAQKQQSKTGSTSDLFKSLFDGVKSSASESMDAIFEEASSLYGLPSGLLKAVARAESNFNPQAVSHAGAMGVMQLMPSTASSLGVSNPFDARQNIMGGAKYLKTQLERFDGDVSLALAAYNAGPGSVEKYGGIPPYAETQNYVKKIFSYMEEPTYQVETGTAQAGYESSASGSTSDSGSSSGSGYLSGLYNALKTFGGMGSLGGNPAAVGSLPGSGEDTSSSSSSSSLGLSGLGMLGSLYGASSLGTSGTSSLGTLGSQYGSSALGALGSLYGSSALGLLGGTSGTSSLGSTYGTSALAGLGSAYGSSALTGAGSLYGMSSIYGSSADLLNLLYGQVTEDEDGETVTMDKKSFYNLVELLRMQMMMNTGNQIGSAIV